MSDAFVRCAGIALLAALTVAACAQPRDPLYPEYAPRADYDRTLTLNGTVMERSRRWTAEGVPHDMMTMRTDEGRVVTVDLGPPGGEGTIAAGDHVTVKGHPARAAGKELVSAHTVIAHTRSPAAR